MCLHSGFGRSRREREGKRSRSKVKGQAKGTYFVQDQTCYWAGIVL